MVARLEEGNHFAGSCGCRLFYPGNKHYYITKRPFGRSLFVPQTN
jgi:hypothetical protein